MGFTEFNFHGPLVGLNEIGKESQLFSCEGIFIPGRRPSGLGNRGQSPIGGRGVF